MTFDPNSAQTSATSAPPNQEGSTGFTAAIPKDMRFATDHSTLAPHQHPELPSTQVPSRIQPHVVAEPPPKLSTDTNKAGQQITLTINQPPNSNTPAAPVQPLPQQPMVQINVQAPTAPNPVPAVTTEPTNRSTSSVAPLPITTAKAPRKLEILRWLTTIGLAGIGMKGFFDSLYFIFVEFQNFEKALEEHLIETANVNPLIMKAALLVFTTALAIFFGMQLSMTSTRKLRFFKVLSSIIVGVCCTLVLQYANSLSVVDSFKNP